ncbi:MAG TPA: hypothetical protein VHT68_00820 [Pseudolabrys sp.]|jgi:hypothetical protein|nr:hypothetical protein [Pseudolabrys sp.]
MVQPAAEVGKRCFGNAMSALGYERTFRLAISVSALCQWRTFPQIDLVAFEIAAWLVSKVAKWLEAK